MFIGLGMPIPDLANKPGPGRPGFPVPGGGVDTRSFNFRVAGSTPVNIKANPQNAGGTFSIKWPNGSTQQYTGNQSSITAPDATEGVVSINLPDEAGETSYCDDFAILGATGSGSRNAVTEVISWGNQGWDRLISAFSNCINLTGIGTTSLKTSTNGQLTSLFQSCTSLTALDMTNWDLSLGARIQLFCKDCTNLAVVEKPTIGVKLVTSSQEAFSNVGTAVAGGCAFNLSGLNISTSSTINLYRAFRTSRINGILSDFSNWVFNSSLSTSMTQMFSSTQVVGQNSFLKLPGWTTVRTTSLSQVFYGINAANEFDGTENLTLDITGFDVSNVASMVSMLGGATTTTGNKISNILGLNTLSSPASGCNLSTSFQGCRFLKLTTEGNFSSAFMNGANPTILTSMFLNLGQGLASGFGVAPNLHSLNLSSASFNSSGLSQFFRAIKTSTLPDFSNIVWPTVGFTFSNLFNGAQLSGANHHLDISPPNSANVLVTSLNSAFNGIQGVSKITLGNNINLSSCTSFNGAFSSSGNAATPLDVTLPTNANYGAVTTWNFAFFALYGINNQNLSTCVGDTLIRRLHATSLNANQQTLQLYNTRLTASPSLVNSQVTALETAGWTINDSATDAVMPFSIPSYTSPTGTTQSITFASGVATNGTWTVTSGVATIDNSTPANPTITAGPQGSGTVRYTRIDGCYNEVNFAATIPLIANNFSFNFDGINDFMTVRSSSSLDTSLNASPVSTVAAWVFKTTANTFATIYANSRANSGNMGMGLLITNANKVQARFNMANNSKTSSASIPINEWVHVAVTYNNVINNGITLYINGIGQSFTPSFSTALRYTAIDPLNTINTAVTVGSFFDAFWYWPGKIDEVAVWDSVLTGPQILDLYNGRLGVTNETVDLSKYENLGGNLIYWNRMGD